jgi:hypothetical protein
VSGFGGPRSNGPTTTSDEHRLAKAMMLDRFDVNGL